MAFKCNRTSGGGLDELDDAPVAPGFMDKVKLDARQQSVIDTVRSGRSVLVTGPAGTGKSQILAELAKSVPVAVTATTGIAAVNVGGATIHSWAGLGITLDPDLIVQKMAGQVKDRIRGTNYLAIDEVSMFSDWMFSVLDYVLRYVRCNNQPFGGMTMIMFADFLQLPPVSVGDMEIGWAFESESWGELDPKVILLEKIYRQEDPDFQKLLNTVRFGRLDEETGKLLISRLDAKDPDPSKPGVKLYGTNSSVDGENNLELSSLDAEEFKMKAEDWAVNDALLPRLDKDCRMQKIFRYKIGARVMLLVNTLGSGLANGSLGTIVSIDPGTKHPTIEFDNGATHEVEPVATEIKSIVMSAGRPVQETIASRTQYPLRLAYAITIHKSQGLTFDKVYAYIAECFEAGHAYVALSRVRTMEGLFIKSSKRGCIRADKKAIAFYEKAKREQEEEDDIPY